MGHREYRSISQQNDISIIFILLPTKESVFVGKVRNADDYKYFKKLTTDEDRIRQGLIQYMERYHFAYIDMAPSLRAMAQQPYFEDADGHPNAIGQEEIAKRC